MKICMDVQYADHDAQVGVVVFENWNDSTPADSFAMTVPATSDYKPGQFFERELPCLVKALSATPHVPSVIIVDGYVWLAKGRPGLGHHLYTALEKSCPVIGIAKTPFRDNNAAIPVCRGNSTRALYVTAVDFSPDDAAEAVKQMHGEFRTPTLVRKADQLARGAE